MDISIYVLFLGIPSSMSHNRMYFTFIINIGKNGTRRKREREGQSCPRAILDFLLLLPLVQQYTSFTAVSHSRWITNADGRALINTVDSISSMYYRVNRNQWLEKKMKSKERRMDCQTINIDEDLDGVECFFFFGYVKSMVSENTRIDECTLCRITVCIDLGR